MTSPHISDDDLERYCMGRVQGPGLHALETHLTGCPACAERAREHRPYVHAMRGAIKMLLDSPEECDTPTQR
jgi:anti-sigma factor RsiW